jgi:hypothetical protein
MKKKKTILIILVIAFMAGAFIGGHEYFKPNPDMTQMKSEFTRDAASFLKEFTSNDSAASARYLGKIIEVSGNIKALEKNQEGYYTLVLGEDGEPSSVRCAGDKQHADSMVRLKVGDMIKIKGVFTGFNKDDTGLLGSDVQLSRCVLVSTGNNSFVFNNRK